MLSCRAAVVSSHERRNKMKCDVQLFSLYLMRTSYLIASVSQVLAQKSSSWTQLDNGVWTDGSSYLCNCDYASTDAAGSGCATLSKTCDGKTDDGSKTDDGKRKTDDGKGAGTSSTSSGSSSSSGGLVVASTVEPKKDGNSDQDENSEDSDKDPTSGTSWNKDVVTSCTTTTPTDGLSSIGGTHHCLDVAFQNTVTRRCWFQYVPQDLRSPAQLTKVPLVLDMHGGGGCAASHALSYSTWRQTADALAATAAGGFVVVFPQAAHPAGNWAATGSEPVVGDKTAHIGDIDFLKLLISHVVTATTSGGAGGQTPAQRQTNANLQIDRERVYASGYSNGCMMAQRLAFEASHVVAGMGCIAGNMMNWELGGRATRTHAINRFSFSTMPVIHVHGDQDDSIQGTMWSFALGNLQNWASVHECNMATSVGGASTTVSPALDTSRALSDGYHIYTYGTPSTSTSCGVQAGSSSTGSNSKISVKLHLVRALGKGHDSIMQPSFDARRLIYDFLAQYKRTAIAVVEASASFAMAIPSSVQDPQTLVTDTTFTAPLISGFKNAANLGVNEEVTVKSIAFARRTRTLLQEEEQHSSSSRTNPDPVTAVVSDNEQVVQRHLSATTPRQLQVTYRVQTTAQSSVNAQSIQTRVQSMNSDTLRTSVSNAFTASPPSFGEVAVTSVVGSPSASTVEVSSTSGAASPGSSSQSPSSGGNTEEASIFSSARNKKASLFPVLLVVFPLSSLLHL
ncbi:unnamed protein product [Amoebophrya sp. A25]|nr:unnamed protein product [Amoebophrya sp. A25]|eukprot:GSA25T00021041001.1